MLGIQWLNNARKVMDTIESSQQDAIYTSASIMADSIQKERWVHTFGCGHATIPVEEMYPRIGGFVGFHPIIELPLSFFTHITGDMGIHQFLFLERTEGYGNQIMKSYDFSSEDTMWLFSHSGINNLNIDIAIESKLRGMKVIVYGSASEAKSRTSRHSSGKNLFDIADVVVDTCAPIKDASVALKNHIDYVGPISTLAFVTTVWMTIVTVAEILESRGVKLFIHPSHNAGDDTANKRLEEALNEYKRRVKIM